MRLAKKEIRYKKDYLFRAIHSNKAQLINISISATDDPQPTPSVEGGTF